MLSLGFWALNTGGMASVENDVWLHPPVDSWKKDTEGI